MNCSVLLLEYNNSHEYHGFFLFFYSSPMSHQVSIFVDSVSISAVPSAALFFNFNSRYKNKEKKIIWVTKQSTSLLSSKSLPGWRQSLEMKAIKQAGGKKSNIHPFNSFYSLPLCVFLQLLCSGDHLWASVSALQRRHLQVRVAAWMRHGGLNWW